MRSRAANDEYSIESDGVTVWVNHNSGYNAARFGRLGVDIHHSPEVVERTGVQCLHCTHGETTPADWDVFVDQMLRTFGIMIPAAYRPLRFG